MALQGVGMIVTDIAFPVPRQQAYARFQGNVGRLQDHRNLGITIYDRIDATTVRESFRRVHYKSSDGLNIGMVTVWVVMFGLGCLGWDVWVGMFGLGCVGLGCVGWDVWVGVFWVGMFGLGCLG